MDTGVRPQDDFYRYVNGGWLAKNPIPAHESRWGSFLILRYDTEKKIKRIVDDTLKLKRVAAGSPEQLIRDFYRSGLDVKTRAKKGLTPLAPYLAKIEKIRDLPTLVSTLSDFESLGGIAPFGLAIDQDMKNSAKYILYLHQSGLGMPDRDYYLNDDAESLRVRSAYVKHIEAMFRLTGLSKSDAKQSQEVVLAIETEIAKAHMTKEELRDVDKTYHKMSVAKLAKLTPNIPWPSYLKKAGAGTPRELIVMQPAYMKAVNTLLGAVSIEEWKVYLRWNLIAGMSSLLSPAFEKQSFSFYGTTLSGVKVMKPLWRRVLRVVDGNLGEALGKLYVKKHFRPEAKKKIAELVADLFEAYEERISGLEWMSTATKKKAIHKLHQMNRKLGYPDRWKSYQGLRITPDDYVGNVLRSVTREHARAMRRLSKPVDRKEWFMTPQTVNAYCSFGLNDVVFPAAILQPPFFDIAADDAVNYGSIGSVIGHEITHGFDDQGSKFDGIGNRKTWWTPEDRKRFEEKAKVLVEQFNTYTVADDLHVNGELTLGENIADLGGASIAFDAYQNRLKKTGRRDLDGFTPEQRFFLSFALFERENRRPEAEKTQVMTDPHSPGQFRINGPASNLPEFASAFDVKPGDALYREPKDRAKIW